MNVEYVIAVEDGSCIGEPVTISNFKTALDVSSNTKIDKAFIEENGYAPCTIRPIPANSTRIKWQNDGYVLEESGWAVNEFSSADKTEEEIDLDAVKTEAKNLVRFSFEETSTLPVVIDGVNWHGGLDSALKLKGAVDIAEFASDTEVTLFDTDNTAHTLSIDDAKAIVLAVGSDFQTKLATKQGLLVAIEEAADLAAVDAVTLPEGWLED